MPNSSATQTPSARLPLPSSGHGKVVGEVGEESALALTSLAAQVEKLTKDLVLVLERVAALELAAEKLFGRKPLSPPIQAPKTGAGFAASASKPEVAVSAPTGCAPRNTPPPMIWAADVLKGAYAAVDPMGGYLQRLGWLRTELASAYPKGIVFGVAQVSTIDGDVFQVATLGPLEAERFLYQMFVTATDGDDVWLFLPPGPIQRYCYPIGYRALVLVSGGGELG